MLFQEDLARATFTTSKYVLPTYEIFINNVLHFTLLVHSWILPKDHELYLSYNSSSSNVSLSKFIPKQFDYFVFHNSDLQQPLDQDEYFRSKSCKLLVFSSENISKNCHA